MLGSRYLFACNRKLLEARCLEAKNASAWDEFQAGLQGREFVALWGLASDHTICTGPCFFFPSPEWLRNWVLGGARIGIQPHLLEVCLSV